MSIRGVYVGGYKCDFEHSDTLKVYTRLPGEILVPRLARLPSAMQRSNNESVSKSMFLTRPSTARMGRSQSVQSPIDSIVRCNDRAGLACP
jgi:hypothetical protein